MIQAQRVMDVIRFLKPGESWTTYSGGIALTVFGAENDVVTMEMARPPKFIRRKVSLTNLELWWADRKDLLAFELVTMASRLGEYNDS